MTREPLILLVCVAGFSTVFVTQVTLPTLLEICDLLQLIRLSQHPVGHLDAVTQAGLHYNDTLTSIEMILPSCGNYPHEDPF